MEINLDTLLQAAHDLNVDPISTTELILKLGWAESEVEAARDNVNCPPGCETCRKNGLILDIYEGQL